MTKKDYIKISDALSIINKRIEKNDLVMETPDKVFNLIIETLSDVFQTDNLLFKRYMFLEAVYKK